MIAMSIQKKKNYPLFVKSNNILTLHHNSWQKVTISASKFLAIYAFSNSVMLWTRAYTVEIRGTQICMMYKIIAPQ